MMGTPGGYRGEAEVTYGPARMGFPASDGSA